MIENITNEGFPAHIEKTLSCNAISCAGMEKDDQSGDIRILPYSLILFALNNAKATEITDVTENISKPI